MQAFDSDSGDGYKKALAFVGGLGKVASPFYPPAGVVGQGITDIVSVLPTDDDDFLGGGIITLPKSTRWGTVGKSFEYKLPGRSVNDQIVIRIYVDEYPVSWYPSPIVT